MISYPQHNIHSALLKLVTISYTQHNTIFILYIYTYTTHTFQQVILTVWSSNTPSWVENKLFLLTYLLTHTHTYTHTHTHIYMWSKLFSRSGLILESTHDKAYRTVVPLASNMPLFLVPFPFGFPMLKALGTRHVKPLTCCICY